MTVRMTALMALLVASLRIPPIAPELVRVILQQESEHTERRARLVRAEAWAAGEHLRGGGGEVEQGGAGSSGGSSGGGSSGGCGEEAVSRSHSDQAAENDDVEISIHLAEAFEGELNTPSEGEVEEADDGARLEIRSTLSLLAVGAALHLEEEEEQEEAWKAAVQAAYHLQVGLAAEEAAERVQSQFETERALKRANAVAERRKAAEQRNREQKAAERRATQARVTAGGAEAVPSTVAGALEVVSTL